MKFLGEQSRVAQGFDNRSVSQEASAGEGRRGRKGAMVSDDGFQQSFAERWCRRALRTLRSRTAGQRRPRRAHGEVRSGKSPVPCLCFTIMRQLMEVTRTIDQDTQNSPRL